MESYRNSYDELLILCMNSYFYTWVVLKNDSTENILKKIENSFQRSMEEEEFITEEDYLQQLILCELGK